MAILRSEIEKALAELVSNEEGMRFQGIAVVLAKEKWPDLIASERKNDLGRDAYAPAVLAKDGRGCVLASSLTAEIGKIRNDLENFRQVISDISVLIFFTPRKVTEDTKERWAATIRQDYSIDLVVVSREDVITDLMKPNNASICDSMLGIPVVHESELSEVIEKTRAAISEISNSWIRRSRFARTPKIELTGVQLDNEGDETQALVTTAGLESALFESQRVIFEGPAGTGKTTTLIQLASRAGGTDSRHLTYLINLPEFLRSCDSLLDFIAKMPPFLSRGISAADLARVYENIHCSFLLNGWNEISDSYLEDAVNALTHLDRNFPTAGIVLATRSHRVRPPLAPSLRVRLRPLSRAQRTEYLRQLLAETASELVTELERDPALDELTRIPLILAQVATLFQAHKPIPKTKMAVLNAVVGLIEGSNEHRDHLERAPLAGNGGEYLTELARYATVEGEVNLSEARARAAIHSVSNRLRSESQIASLPEPADILSILCAHHVLERIDYPSIAFRFQHQQFQEFYAAVALRRDLSGLILENDSVAKRSFARDFINRPAWEESLRMLAEAIGQAIGEESDHNSLATAKQLIDLTVDVDPIFAADLARLCGDRVWQEVRDLVSERLRSWRADTDDHHRQCALAGMLASGSPDYSDVLLPLLTSHDQQVRLKAYRAWHQYHVSSFGPDWPPIVGAWNEDCRTDFVGEVARQRQAAHLIEQFALGDPSRKVRVSAVQALFFAGAPEGLRRVLNAIDDAAFQDIVRTGMLDRPPSDLRAWVLSAYRALLATAEAPLARMGIMLSMLALGEGRVQEDIFGELARIPSAAISNDRQWSLRSLLEKLRRTDSQRVSEWVVDRIINGSLSGSHWLAFVTSLSEDQRRLLLEQITERELSPFEMHRLADLAPAADADLCRGQFSGACAIESRLAPLAPDAHERPHLAAICRQIRDFLRKAPAQIALAGILAALSPERASSEYELLVETFGSVGDEDFYLGAQLDDELRGRVREYLMSGIPWVLSQDDSSGNLKAIVATTLARIGEAEDIEVLGQLIRADIRRRRIGLEARLRGDRGPIGNGAATSYSNWHVGAVCRLGVEAAEPLLIELLQEPEYEQDAARGLLQLARKPAASPEPPIPLKPRDYTRIWVARGESEPSGFDEERRRRWADAIRNTISVLVDNARTTDLASSRFRAKKLAAILAALDPENSAEFVLQTLESPSQWDHWDRVQALQAILFGGGRLVTRQALDILQPVIQHTTGSLYDQQQRYLLTQCLCILPFVDEPSAGIARIRGVLDTRTLHGFELRELIVALGQSRCNDALALLLDIGRRNATALQGAAVEWIDAINSLDTPEGKQVLLSFADPDVSSSGVERRFEHHELCHLAAQIAGLARGDSAVVERLFSLCAYDLDTECRQLLAQILTVLGTPDALIAALNLIRDQANPPIPFELVRGLEAIFLEYRPYGNSGHRFTLEPRAASPVRRRLFEMVINDNTRTRSAWSLLGQTELWRIEYGRPSNEPRHPQIDSGLPWPPLGSHQPRNETPG